MTETAWMGRYRSLIAAIVLHGNNVSRVLSSRTAMSDDVTLSQPEWQILEYLLENEQDDDCMNRISERLGIPQSSLSKAVKTLCGFGLVERFRRGRNRKNVILRATGKGRELYRAFVPVMIESSFAGFFEALEEVSDADLAAFTEAIRRLTRGMEEHRGPSPLIPLEQENT